jgi:hypothetical protein
MCCDDIICIENIVDLQATYTILDLSLSDLITNIINDCKIGVINILDVRVFLRALQNLPFSDEDLARTICIEVGECIENELYGKGNSWNIKEFLNKIQQIQELIIWDYTIGGSLTVYNNCQQDIFWDLEVNVINIEQKSALTI